MNQDMSAAACIERAEHHAEHARLLERIEKLEGTCETTLKVIQLVDERVSTNLAAMKLLGKMVNLNRDSIRELHDNVRSRTANGNRGHLDSK